MRWVRGLVAEVVWAARRVGYWVRPYDMLADARRWRWRPRQRCGFASGGLVRGPGPVLLGDDRVVVRLSGPEQVVDRVRAEALGLGVAFDHAEGARPGVAAACMVMVTRRCPVVFGLMGCPGPCARFESGDEGPWRGEVTGGG